MVPEREDRHQRLVYRPDADLGEECLLPAVGQPGHAIRRRGLLARGVPASFRASFDLAQAGPELACRACPAVGQRHVRGSSPVEEVGVRSGHALEHGVGRRHRRKPEEEAVGAACRHQAMNKDQRGLGLPAPGDVLDDE